MADVTTQRADESARHGPSRRRVALVVVGYVVWIFVIGVAAFLLSFAAHFDCGGTLGGFGESASARLDESCYEDRMRFVGVGVLGAALLPAIGYVLWRRRRSTT
jgi:hypothetical protein